MVGLERVNESGPSFWKAFFDKDPYEGFPIQDYVSDVQGWGNHPIMARVIETIRPKLIVEVGTWKGASAIYMAHLLGQLGIIGQLICVDTFLGSPEHYFESELYDLMKIKNGRPTLYEQFLANVIFEKLQDVIVPLAQTSEGAYRILAKKGMRPDLVYVDCAHDYDSVKRDLENYWELLRPGGVLIGDDFDEKAWPGVVRAATEFAAQKNLRLFSGEGKYILDKSAGTSSV